VIPIGNTNGHGAQGALGVFFDITRTERLENIRQEFLSNVSHELRTPLTAIIAFVETLENGAMEDPESSQRFLSIIRKNASRMQSKVATYASEQRRLNYTHWLKRSVSLSLPKPQRKTSCSKTTSRLK
jgi:signal transduction histidine kinase